MRTVYSILALMLALLAFPHVAAAVDPMLCDGACGADCDNCCDTQYQQNQACNADGSESYQLVSCKTCWTNSCCQQHDQCYDQCEETYGDGTAGDFACKHQGYDSCDAIALADGCANCATVSSSGSGASCGVETCGTGGQLQNYDCSLTTVTLQPGDPSNGCCQPQSPCLPTDCGIERSDNCGYPWWCAGTCQPGASCENNECVCTPAQCQSTDCDTQRCDSCGQNCTVCNDACPDPGCQCGYDSEGFCIQPDSCGVCGGDGTECGCSWYDCNGVCNGSATYDACGVCGGDGSECGGGTGCGGCGGGCGCGCGCGCGEYL